MNLADVNRPASWWGPKIYPPVVVDRYCPTEIEFSMTDFTFDSTCPFFSLDDDGFWSFDSTHYFVSSTTITMDENT